MGIGRYLVAGTLGIAAGIGGGIAVLRAGDLGATRIGPWATSGTFGSAAADPLTRAIVAVRGLLALPAYEARYYTATVDDGGEVLDGRCRYRLTGGPVPARWWSLTLYDANGYLVANPAERYSLANASVVADRRGRWAAMIAPEPVEGTWLPTGGIDRFELTLRVYLPADGGRGDLARAQLPRITRLDCG